MHIRKTLQEDKENSQKGEVQNDKKTTQNNPMNENNRRKDDTTDSDTDNTVNSVTLNTTDSAMDNTKNRSEGSEGITKEIIKQKEKKDNKNKKQEKRKTVLKTESIKRRLSSEEPGENTSTPKTKSRPNGTTPDKQNGKSNTQ